MSPAGDWPRAATQPQRRDHRGSLRTKRGERGRSRGRFPLLLNTTHALTSHLPPRAGERGPPHATKTATGGWYLRWHQRPAVPEVLAAPGASPKSLVAAKGRQTRCTSSYRARADRRLDVLPATYGPSSISVPLQTEGHKLPTVPVWAPLGVIPSAHPGGGGSPPRLPHCPYTRQAAR